MNYKNKKQNTNSLFKTFGCAMAPCIPCAHDSEHFRILNLKIVGYSSTLQDPVFRL